MAGPWVTDKEEVIQLPDTFVALPTRDGVIEGSLPYGRAVPIASALD
jgi:hypothetical protein